MRTILAAAAMLSAGLLHAQPAANAAADGLIVGSGNYFSPIVRDLDQALAFYRDGLGLEVQGPPGDASANPALRNMFGLPDAKIRWAIARTPAASCSSVSCRTRARCASWSPCATSTPRWRA